MTVSLSPVGGAASQFFNSGGVPLYGGKIYTYEAGTTTPKATYTEANGLTTHSNPIILDSAGRVPGGEIWLTSAQAYLFILKTSSDETVGTYDNIYGYSAGAESAVTEVQIATAGQTSFTLTSMVYTPTTHTLGVYIDGVNQVVNNSYVETSATTVTFVSGLHVGAVVKFININSTATSSDLVTYLPGGAGAVPTTVQAKLRESVSILDFGGVSGADCTAAFTAAFAALASGGKLYLPPGTWQTTGGHTVPQRVTIVGAGMGVTFIQHTTANNVLFNLPLVGGNEAAVEYGGNVFEGFTAYGTSAANTATAIKIKNKVNIKFDHVELYDFGTLVAGVRDNVANSVNSVLFNAIRFGACVTAINAPLAWNGVTIQGASQFFSSTGWTIINYDSANWNIDASTTFTANQTGTGHVYFGGCTGWVVNAYFEGNPTIGYYFSARSQKDKDGNATNGGIAIGYVRSGTMQGMTARSAGGTSYVVRLDATNCVVATGCHAGSGINVSFAYVTTGTRGNSFIGCYPNPGTVATFQTAADADYNTVQNYLTGSIAASKAFPTAPAVVGGTSAGASTGGTQTGYYCRVGDVCHFTVSVNWTAHTGTGQLRVNNLPFTSNANTVQTFSIRTAQTSAGDITQVTGYIPAGSTQLRLEKYAAGAVSDLAIPGAGNFVISGSYLL